MKGLLLHTAADTTNLRIVGPLFEGDKFEFIPIDNSYGRKTKTYTDFPARNKAYGNFLSDFIPSKFSDSSVHFDPEFENFTYAQPVDKYPRSEAFRHLEAGDIVFFVFSLSPYNPDVYRERDSKLRAYQIGKKEKYVTGFFTVQGVAQISILKSKPRLTLALRNVAVSEEGEQALSAEDLKEELKTLEEWKYVLKDNDGYKLTLDDCESSRNGRELADLIDDLWPNSEDEQKKLLEKGVLEISNLSGHVSEDDVKGNHHYIRLRSLDWDRFILVKGKPDSSVLLDKAVKLTNGFEQTSFRLNSLGQTILGREKDTLRGFRWIDEKSVGILAKEIVEQNPEMRSKMRLG
jgi:hypothetical protein